MSCSFHFYFRKALAFLAHTCALVVEHSQVTLALGSCCKFFHTWLWESFCNKPIWNAFYDIEYTGLFKIPHSLTGSRNPLPNIRSLPRLGTAFAARTETVALPLDRTSLPLRLNAFRGDPASSEFDWNFTANHSSSPDFSTSGLSIIEACRKENESLSLLSAASSFTSTTFILFCVSVPVLSVQIKVTDPSVSTEGSFLMSAFF